MGDYNCSREWAVGGVKSAPAGIEDGLFEYEIMQYKKASY